LTEKVAWLPGSGSISRLLTPTSALVGSFQWFPVTPSFLW
jgi:hypothetical protein